MVVQHLRDHVTFNLKFTIVVVMGQKGEFGFSQFVVHPTLKEHGHIHTMLTKCTVWSPLIVHVVKVRRNSGWEGRTVRNLADNVWGGGVLGCQALGRLVSLISVTRLVDQAYAATFTPPGVAPSVRSGGRSGASSLSGGGSAGAGLLLALGAATLNLEIARRRYGDPGGERGDGNDACTTVSTFDSDKKNAVTVTRSLARGRRFQNRYKTGRRPKKVLTVVGGSNCALLPHFYKNFSITKKTNSPSTSALCGVSGKRPLFPPRRRGDREFTPGSRGTRHGFRPAKIRFVTKDKTLRYLKQLFGFLLKVVSSGTTATSSTDKTKEEKSKEKVVDLTCSDSDDDEPLAKRRVVNPKPDSTIKFSDTTSISSSSNQSRVTTTPGPSSVSSSGYPASPSIITLDSPSPPRSPQNEQQTQQLASCMMANQNGTSNNQPTNLFSPGSMPFLDLDNEAASANMNYPTGY
ncbi:hypothetical protein Zmor_011640 [Zophobas morio]|uniref:Uncharacterized protein n=1 Tax=Zophobas morio TaxID=2755281 RepID=A0AA38IQF4_9CUCU|nr:hypothetical protein Zmor_011640 [Zophobas morio]